MSNPLPLAAIDQIVRLQEQCVALAAERDVLMEKKRDFTNGSEIIAAQVKRIQELETKLDGWFVERGRLQTALERIARNMKGCAERWEKFPNLRHTELGAIVAAKHIAEAALEKK